MTTKTKRKYKEKKFKIMKSETGIVVYKWAYQCPKCKAIMKYDFGKSMWTFENSGGLGMECFNCKKFGQVITLSDVQEAKLISPEEFSKLQITEEPKKPELDILEYFKRGKK